MFLCIYVCLYEPPKGNPILAATDRSEESRRALVASPSKIKEYYSYDYTCFAWAGGSFFHFQLCCYVSFLFWREMCCGFTYYLCTLEYHITKLWCCVSFFCSGGNYFLVFHTYGNFFYSYSCAVVSVFWFWREIVLKMRTRFYKKILLGYVLYYDPFLPRVRFTRNHPIFTRN
jgi:hypothetical protein